MNEFEVLRVIKLMERTQSAFEGLMPVSDDRPFWNTAAHLMKSDYSNQVVTITSLCSVTGLPYATSRRLIQSLIERGLIVQSLRGTSGKTYSLHPSDELKAAFNRYAKEIKGILAEMVGARASDGNEAEYYLGAPRPSNYVPPASLAKTGDSTRELKFLVNDDNYFSALRNLWTDFRSNLGSSRNFSLRRCPEIREELIENSKRSVSSYDIVSVNLPWLGELVENGMLQPIADLLDQTRYSSSVADADLKSLGQWNGQTYGVPIYCSVSAFAARSDLFEEAELKFPSTFDDVISAGRALSAPHLGRYGIVWDAAPGTPIATTFMTLMAAAGGSPLSARGSRNALVRKSFAEDELADIVVGDSGYRTLSYMHRLVEISPPNILDMAWDDSLDVFMAGQAAMSYSWSMRATRTEYDVRSVIKRKVKYLPQPAAFGGTRASPLSGFLLAVPSNLPKERARLAIEAIGWLVSAESAVPQASHGLPLAPRFAVTADPEMKASSRLISHVQDLAQKGLLHTQHRPATPQFSRIETILGQEIHAAMTRAKSDDTALADAAARIARLARNRHTLLDVAVASLR